MARRLSGAPLGIFIDEGGSVALSEADRIVVGREVLVFCAGPEPGTTRTDLG